jgi:hypothetical protein
MANDINLAALWVPVLPETSQIAPAMRKAGEDAKKEFAQGFSPGSGGSESPEALGRKWAEQMHRSFSATFDGMPMPKGMKDFMESLGNETKVTATQFEKLQKQVKATYEDYSKAAREATHYQSEFNRLTAQAAREQAEQGKASIFTMGERKKAWGLLNSSVSEARVKHDEYTSATHRMDEAQGRATKGSQLMSAAIGGLAGGAATLGIQAITAGFEKIIELAKEAASFVLESGEAFEEMGSQIKKYSLATGSEFNDLKDSAAQVFVELGEGGENLGKDIATLAGTFDLPKEKLIDLTRHLEVLEGKYNSFDVDHFVQALADFGVEGDRADSTLASLLKSARGANVDFGEMMNSLTRVSDTLSQSGLTAEQSGAFIANLQAHVADSTQAINSLSTAQAKFSKDGLSFRDGMKMATQVLDGYIKAGDTAKANKYAEFLFGSRRWTDAADILKDFNAALALTPEALSATGTEIDQFQQDTDTLADKIENLKKRAMEALSPLGEFVIGVFSKAIDGVKTYITTHSEEIKEKIKSIGHAFIDSLPMIQMFAAQTIEMLGMVGDMVIKSLVVPIGQFSAGLEIAKGAFSGNWNEVKQGWDLLKKMQELQNSPSLQDKGKQFADTIRGWKIDTEGFHEEWDDMVSGVNANPIEPQLNMPTMPSSLFPQGNSSSTPPSGPLIPPGIGNSGAATPSMSPSGSSPIPGVAAPNTSVSPLEIMPGVPLSSSPQVALKSQSTPMNNPESWRSTVRSVLRMIGPQYGVQNYELWENRIVDQIKTESGGNAQAYNGKDSNGQGGTQTVRGLLQFLDTTYAVNNILGRPVGDPVGQIAALIPYVMGKYGQDESGGPNQIGRGVGYYMGGTVGMHPGQPNGRDTVPIWAEPGEEVVNAQAAQRNRALLKLINSGALHFEGGGTIPGAGTVFDPTGAQVNTLAVAAAVSRFFPQIKTIGLYRGPDGYNEHSSGEAADVMNTDVALGNYMKDMLLRNAGALGIKYILWQQRNWKPDGTSSPMDDRGSPTANHMDHLHVRTSGGGWMQGNDPGSTGLATGKMPSGTSSMAAPTAAGIFGQYTAGGGGGLPGDPFGMLGSNPQFPGLPGQYGGYGQYGGQDYESMRRNEKAVKDAKDRLTDMDWAISEQEKEIARRRATLERLKTETEMTSAGEKRKASDEEIAAADDALASATHDLAVKRRERGDQEGNIADAERKQAEDAMKPPAGAKEGKGRGGKDYSSMFSQLGSGLMQGVAQEMGFGEVFGKAPWEWGIVKLLGGLAGWGVGTANAWADHIGAGNTGLTGFQPIPGYNEGAGILPGGGGGSGGLGGMLGALPSLVPSNNIRTNVTNGPNVDPNTTTHGQGGPQFAPGPNLGPAVDNSMNVQFNGVPVDKSVQNLQAVQNSTSRANAMLPKN